MASPVLSNYDLQHDLAASRNCTQSFLFVLHRRFGFVCSVLLLSSQMFCHDAHQHGRSCLSSFLPRAISSFSMAVVSLSNLAWQPKSDGKKI